MILEISLPTALLGAVMGAAVLSVTMLYARTVTAAPAALDWWAVAFLTLMVSLLMQFPDPGALGRPVLWMANAFHAAAAVLVLFGALAFLGVAVRDLWVGLGIAFVLAWPFLASYLAASASLGGSVAMGVSGIPFLVAAGAFLLRRPPRAASGHGLAAASFGLWGVLTFVEPFMRDHPTLHPWTYVIVQVLAITTAISLMVVVLRRQQHQAEAEGERANRTQLRFMDAVESISEGFVLWDADDRLVMHNRKYKELMPGLSDLIRPGVLFDDLVHAAAARGLVEEARGRERQWIVERLEAHRNPQAPFLQTFTDGRCILSREYRTSDGGLVAIRTDVTDQKRFESALQDSQQRFKELAERLRAIIENMPLGITVYDPALKLVEMNRWFQQMLGLPRSLSRPGTPMAEIVRTLAGRGEYGEGEAKALAKARMKRLTGEGPDRFEWHRPGGMILEVRRVRMPNGGFLHTYTDISEQKQTERVLREARDAAERGNRAKAAFLASISHELRTPLNAIIGFSETMREELFGPLGNDTYKTYARDIHDSGTHLLNLINEILDMSKAEAGRIELDERPLDLALLGETCLRMVSERAAQGGLVLRQDIPDTLPRLWGDEKRIIQTILNLLSNAVKFTDPGGTVTLSAHLDDQDRINIEIADTGIGMKPEDLHKAMVPFAQVDSRLERKYEGTGLGLPLTRALVDRHGGVLSIHSVFGEGTVVTLRFPAERTCRDHERDSEDAGRDDAGQDDVGPSRRAARE